MTHFLVVLDFAEELRIEHWFPQSCALATNKGDNER